MKKAFWALCLLVAMFPKLAFADLTIHFLDVGQGDAAIVQCDGETMIIDGGPGKASSFIYAYVRNTLRLETLDYVVATHPHEDHVGGIAAVLNAVPVDLILSPVLSWETRTFDSLVKYAEMQGTPIIIPETGEVLSLGSATCTILHCWPDAWDTNDMSICLRIDYGDTSFLFTGDAEYMAEYIMLDSGLVLSADVLKVGHHGSKTSSTVEFLNAVSPKFAVISCGKGNSYGHPHEITLESLKNLDVQLYRTDLQGTITCKSDGKAIVFSTERNAAADVFSPPNTPEVLYDEN